MLEEIDRMTRVGMIRSLKRSEADQTRRKRSGFRERQGWDGKQSSTEGGEEDEYLRTRMKEGVQERPPCFSFVLSPSYVPTFPGSLLDN